MRVTIPEQEGWEAGGTKKNRSRLLRWCLSSMVVALLCILVFTGLTVAEYRLLQPIVKKRVWEWAQQRGHAEHEAASLHTAFLQAPGKMVRPVEAAPVLAFDIRFKHMQTLSAKRDAAIKAGRLIQEPDDFVPASIRVGDRTVAVKIRLKGDLTDHLMGDKWSFRVHVRGDDQIFGLRRFSIQNPSTRAFQGAVLFNETLKHVGVMYPRYSFAKVIVNGNDIGLMAVEEHFSKELLEHNGRRDGVIVKFDERLLFDYPRLPNPFDNYKNAPIDAFRTARIDKSPRLSEEYAAARSLLRGFVEGTLNASDVFDAPQTGAYLAASKFLGTYHCLGWRNWRFHFNPFTRRLEPIGFDAMVNAYNRKAVTFPIREYSPFSGDLLKDEAINAAFLTSLQELVDAALSGTLLEELKKTEARILPLLQKEFFLLQGYSYDDAIARAKALDKYVYPVESLPENIHPSYPAIFTALSMDSPEGGHVLQLRSSVPVDVTIHSIQWVSRKDGTIEPFACEESLGWPLSLPAMPIGSAPHFLNLPYTVRHEDPSIQLEVEGSMVGESRIYRGVAQSSVSPASQRLVPMSTPDKQVLEHPFLTIETEKQQLVIQAGTNTVASSILVPEGWPLVIHAGAVLHFQTNAGIVARAPLLFHGTEESPIVLKGSSTNDTPGWWPGVTVLQAGDTSSWSHVEVRNTTGTTLPGWHLTGAVTFYQSDVRMAFCTFDNTRSEDALNTIHSAFHFDHVRILNTVSDAFDADFSSGTMSNCLFQHIGKAGGGDAIDVSGSEIRVSHSTFDAVSDKALSVGENSRMQASHVDVHNCGVAAASKDGSRLTLSDSRGSQLKVAGMMAYSKKPEYGPAEITANHVIYEGTMPVAIAENGSRILIDGKAVRTQTLNVEELYDTVMKPGLRR